MISEACNFGCHKECAGIARTELDTELPCRCPHHAEKDDPRLTGNQVIYPEEG